MRHARVGVSDRTAADAVSDSLAGEPVVAHPNLAAGPVAGPTLERILEGSRLRTEQVAVIGIGILAGLRALHRAGAGHANLEPAAVLVAPNGQARLVGYGAGSNWPAAEIMAAGRVICAALGVRPGGKAALADRSRARLVAAAQLIAGGGAGFSATNALMIFGDAAGRVSPGIWIERTAAGIERLGMPHANGIGAAVDRLVMRPAAAPKVRPPVMARPAPARVIAQPLPSPEKDGPPSVATSAAIPVPTERQSRPDRSGPTDAAAPISSSPSQPSADGASVVTPAQPVKVAQPSRRLGRYGGLVATLAVVVGVLVVAAGYHRADPRVPGRPTFSPIASPAVAQRVPPTVAAPPVPVPETVVSDYYQLVAGHKFDQALALWDGHLRELLGPSQYPQQRFADTTEIVVNSHSVLGQDASTATVKVDLTEVTNGVQHHWVGTWRLVQSGGTWLLDEPDFLAA